MGMVWSNSCFNDCSRIESPLTPMKQTTDNQYFSLLEQLNRIPVIVPELTKKQYSVKQEKQMLYDDLMQENGEATW